MKAPYYAPLLITAELAAFVTLSGCNTATGSDSSTTTSASSSSSSATGAYTLSDGSSVFTSGSTYAATASDVSAIYVTGGTLTLADPAITKSGDVSSTESCKKGLNAAVLASSSGAKIAITGGSIASTAKGGNAAFAYNGASFSLSGTTITCTGSAEARALYATYGGVITATSVTASTTGNNSSVVATDQGGGTITLTGGSFTASGTDSAGLYSTGTITGHGVTATSSSGEACVIEGSNSISLDTASVLSSGSSKRGILILQSGSGDATGYDAKFTMTGGSITTTKTASDATSSKDAYRAAPMFEVATNTTGTITLTDVALSIASGVLMEVDYDTGWTTSGATGTMVLATASAYSVTGDVYVDGYSNASMTVGSGVTWSGAFVKSGPKAAAVTVSSGGVWNLSADSYVTSLVNNGTINKNGHTLYVNGVAQG